MPDLTDDQSLADSRRTQKSSSSAREAPVALERAHHQRAELQSNSKEHIISMLKTPVQLKRTHHQRTKNSSRTQKITPAKICIIVFSQIHC